ncbi:8855_t:CDS:2, partial [Dentiscutata erythropus]
KVHPKRPTTEEIPAASVIVLARNALERCEYASPKDGYLMRHSPPHIVFISVKETTLLPVRILRCGYSPPSSDKTTSER